MAPLARKLPAGRTLRVAVVGAGFAGLRAAARLLRQPPWPLPVTPDGDGQNGRVEVTIFEARARVGGRVAQATLCGHLVDLGPNWIHGTVDNPMVQLAEETSTRLHEWPEGAAIFDVDGTRLPAHEVAECASDFWEIVGKAFKYSRENCSAIPPSETLADFVARQAADKYHDRPPAVAARRRRLLLQESEMWGCFVGGTTARQSLRWFWLEECVDGANPFVAGTYERILHRVAADAAAAELHLGVEVMRIVPQACNIPHGPAEVVVHLSRPDSGWPGETIGPFGFDEVIVTSPLGFLKDHHTHLFEPLLPPRLVAAIEGVGYGNLEKVYITFPKAFWQESLGSSSPAENGVDISKLHPAFTHWHDPRYAHVWNPKRYNQQAMNLAALPGDTAHPTLLFYVSGPCAVQIQHLLAVNSDPARRTEALDNFFRPYYSLLPGYDASKPECAPAGILATEWSSDELAGRGSYANFTAGEACARGLEDVEALRAGAPDTHRVWLAGEHTAPPEHLGTAAGAYLSGERAAEAVLRAYGLLGPEAEAEASKGAGVAEAQD